VLHQAYIKVDEEGTEAAAASAVVISRAAVMTFRADHPFIFIIQERKTGNILFIGRIVNPTTT
jgi:serpin B